VQIEIYNTAGALVRNIEDSFTPEGSWSNDITWDGTDNSGVPLASGIYVYRLNVTSDRGFVSSAYQKLVIVR
jgi:flagellar hook assembly protein FlgD